MYYVFNVINLQKTCSNRKSEVETQKRSVYKTLINTSADYKQRKKKCMHRLKRQLLVGNTITPIRVSATITLLQDSGVKE